MSSAQRGRPKKITRERLAEVTSELGLIEFRLAEVACRLDVTIQTLYNHVQDREELQHLAADLLEERRTPPDESLDWPDMWRAWAYVLKDVYARHPGLGTILMSRPLANSPPLKQPVWETCQRVAERYGFHPEVAVWVNLAIHEFVYSWAAREDAHKANTPPRPAAHADPRFEMQAPRFVQAAHAVQEMPFDLRFDMTLEAMLAGMATLRGRDLAPRSSPGSPAP